VRVKPCRIDVSVVALWPLRNPGQVTVVVKYWRTIAHVLAAGGTVPAVFLATCARVCMRGVVLIMDSACCRHAVCRFCARTRLMGLVGRVGVLLVVSLGLGTPGTGGDMLIICVILRFISVWGRGTSANVCTLRTCCPLVLSVGVAACSNHLGCAFMCACVAPTMSWRFSVAGEVLSLPVMPWMALMQLTKVHITLSVCVIE
jgi:hypothetical protein